MADQIIVRLEGMEELNIAFNEAVRSVSSQEVAPILLRGAWRIAGTAKSYASLGPTGNLRKAQRAQLLPSVSNIPSVAIAKSDRRRAPHSHLVEYGTGERIAKRGKYRGRRFGIMPATPFFWLAVQQKYNEVVQDIITELSARIKKVLS